MMQSKRNLLAACTLLTMLAVTIGVAIPATNAQETSTTETECPASNFIDVTQFEGAGVNYPAPELRVRCEGDTLIVESNGITHYEFVPMTPNPLTERDTVFEITLTPELADETSEIPLLGRIGFAVNGLSIFGPNEGGQPAAQAFGDPIYNGIMDECLGHTANEYHYHGLVTTCFFPDYVEGEPSPIIGYALDGFPIYGSYGCLDEDCTEVIEFKSSYVEVADPTTYAWDAFQYEKQDEVQYLDECNGRIGPDGTYRYHATDTFPYIIGCYAGTPTNASGTEGRNGQGNRQPPDGEPGNGQPPDGNQGSGGTPPGGGGGRP